MDNSFRGAWPALITPASAAGGVNLTALRELIDYMLAKKVDGLYLLGGTGEGLLISAADRRAVVEAAMDQVRGRVPVIVHVGSISTPEAAALACHSQEHGADGVSSVLPVYLGGLDATYRHYGAIAAAAPGLPFFPYLFGGQIDATALMKELLCRIPNVGGAKYTGPNMYEIAQIIDLGGDLPADRGWTIFSGMDEQCIFAAMMNAPGNIGSTLNVMPGPYLKMRECYEAGDAAKGLALQKQANRLTAVMIDHGVGAALRVSMKALGIDCGPLRLPQETISPQEEEIMLADLEAAGLAELAAM
jgi:N-acetylneuraminate lyase